MVPRAANRPHSRIVAFRATGIQMISPEAEAAAAYLAAARQDRSVSPAIPAACRPADIETALTIQTRIGALLGATVGGWKCSLPTAARAVIAAPIFASTIVTAPDHPTVVAGSEAKMEPEIAFVLGRDLPAREVPYSEAEVRAAVREAHLVLELIGSRYTDSAAVSYPEHLADCIANQGLFVGPLVDNALDRPLDRLAISVRTPAGTLLTRDGVHQDGHPLRPLVWLANFLSSRGESLQAGQIVTTGSYCGVLDVPIGVPLTVQYGDLPALSATLGRAQ